MDMATSRDLAIISGRNQQPLNIHPCFEVNVLNLDVTTHGWKLIRFIVNY